MLPWGQLPQNVYGQTGQQMHPKQYANGNHSQPTSPHVVSPSVKRPNSGNMQPVLRRSTSLSNSFSNVSSPKASDVKTTPNSSVAKRHSGNSVSNALELMSDEDVDKTAKKMQEKLDAQTKAKAAEEEKTHIKTRVGAKVGVDRGFPEGRYVIRKLLGKGVYGKVFECVDKKYDDSLVAVKIVRDEALFRMAGQNEIKVLKKLEGKCGVLRLCRDFIHLNHVCISVDLYGESLAQKLDRVGSFTTEQVADVGLQLLHAINHMHKCGIVHTDLKTENVLVYHRPDPSTGIENDEAHFPLSVRVVDLGSATFEDAWHQPLIGTNEYRAPESVLQTGWSHEVDVWGIGCVLAELATGRKLFGDELSDQVHLLLMERCLEKDLPENLLRKSWTKGVTKKSNILQIQGGANNKIRVNRVVVDVLQERKMRAAYVLSQAVTDATLMEVLKKLLEFDPLKRAKAGPLRSHPFFNRARFDKSDINIHTAYPPILPPDDPRVPTPMLQPMRGQIDHTEIPAMQSDSTLRALQGLSLLSQSHSNPPDVNITPPPSSTMRPSHLADLLHMSPLMAPIDGKMPAMHTKAAEVPRRSTAISLDVTSHASAISQQPTCNVLGLVRPHIVTMSNSTKPHPSTPAQWLPLPT
eukprot:CAMPEP_0179439324 /NCGR_PEP_ID=MMETSP0799-20121207/22959_1 /TAXON_ID=46947 /ORGANISM="Geminigera cryophila, Strain CCMP2564" /LENGTH=635 /DNA_ID=CAMNT_0021221631 /DNA_START=51 /DNA_END=1954 /DNA_ORIENTATION=-